MHPMLDFNLKYDDIILSFGGIDVLDQNHLINLVSLTPIEHRVSVVLLRDGRKVNVMVELANRRILDELERKQRESQQSSRRFGTSAEPMSFHKVKHASATEDLAGLGVQPMNADLAAQLGFAQGQAGLLVLGVDEQSSFSGVVDLYDVIEEVAGSPVRSLQDFRQALDQHRDLNSLVLKISRGKPGSVQQQLVIWQR